MTGLTLRRAVTTLCIVTLLVGCATKTQTGAAVGGVAGAGVGGAVGGAVGGRTGAAIGILVGAAVGALVGGVIGNRLDARDKERRNAALQASLQAATPQPIRWVNPDTGNSGTLTAGATYQAPGSQRLCRTFEESYTRDGSTHTQQSQACLGEDGTWVMQN